MQPDRGYPRVRSLGRFLFSRTGRVLGTATALLVTLSAALALPAYAVPTDIAVSPLALNFGEVNVGATSSSMSVQVTNTGGDPFGPINLFGGAPPSAEFNASQNCQGNTLAAGASCSITYTFSPTAPGQFSDNSSFTVSETASQSDGEDFDVALSGTGCGNPCPPTITNFTPTSGQVGTSVVITGTRLTGATALKFGGVSATTFTVNSATQITATVPAGAVTGPIAVTTPGGTATSTTNFTVALAEHDRAITLNLRGHLVARGRIISDFTECQSDRIVRVQRRRPDAGWKNVGSGTTNDNGGFRIEVRDRVGIYRAVVPDEIFGGTDVCLAATSNRDRHVH